MRVVLEIDGIEKLGPSGAEAVSAVATDAPVDAGSGPSGETGSGEAAEAVVAVDSGPPPDWLLQAIAAAEAESRGAATAQAAAWSEEGDAGAGPTA